MSNLEDQLTQLTLKWNQCHQIDDQVIVIDGHRVIREELVNDLNIQAIDLLLTAIDHKNLSIIKQIKLLSPQVNMQELDNKIAITPLQDAVKSGEAGLVAAVLAFKLLDVNAAGTSDARTALFIATDMDNAEMVRALLSYKDVFRQKIDPDYVVMRDSVPMHPTALSLAATKENMSIYHLMLDAGADPSKVVEGFKSANQILYSNRNKEIPIARLERAQNVQSSKLELERYIKLGDIEEVRKLLAENPPTYHHLELALNYDSVAMIHLLLEPQYQLNVNHPLPSGLSMLEVALNNKRMDVLNVLLAIPNINASEFIEKHSTSPIIMLRTAITQGDESQLNKLLNLKPAPEVPLVFLLEHGVQSPMIEKFRTHHMISQDFLVSKEALNQRDNITNEHSLEVVMKIKDPERRAILVLDLLEKGALVEASSDKQLYTPLDRAKQNGDERVVSYMKLYGADSTEKLEATQNAAKRLATKLTEAFAVPVEKEAIKGVIVAIQECAPRLLSVEEKKHLASQVTEVFKENPDNMQVVSGTYAIVKSLQEVFAKHSQMSEVVAKTKEALSENMASNKQNTKSQAPSKPLAPSVTPQSVSERKQSVPKPSR